MQTNIFEIMKPRFSFDRNKTIKVFEAFSGIGTQRMALETLEVDFDIVATSEIDKYAVKSYEEYFGHQLNYGDIRYILGTDLPQLDLFTYSFPCQDLSIAGKQKGLNNTRSGLVYEVLRILSEMKENNTLPRVLLMENVTALVSWHKPSCMPESVKSRFTKDYEMIYMFSKSKKYKFNPLTEPMVTNDLSRPRGAKGSLQPHSGSKSRNEKSKKTEFVRNMRSVWSICEKNRTNHIATFPIELASRLIKCSTDRNDTVLDLFAGSFTTSVAAKQLDRNCICIELNKEYCKMGQERINNTVYQSNLFEEE